MATQIDELRRAIHKEGYDTRLSGGHYQVFDAEGKPVRHKTSNNPITFASTPGGGRSIDNIVATLRRNGVLPTPAAPKPRTNGGKKLGRQRLAQYCSVLRDELKKIMAEADPPLRQADVWRYADYYAGQHGLAVPARSEVTISQFLKGGNLNDVNYKWLSAAVSAIKANEGKIPRSGELQKMPSPKDEPKPIEVEAEDPKPAPNKLPKLAFDLMQAIYNPDKDHDTIRALIDEVARLELGRD
jgi:hypothetical protein